VAFDGGSENLLLLDRSMPLAAMALPLDVVALLQFLCHAADPFSPGLNATGGPGVATAIVPYPKLCRGVAINPHRVSSSQQQ
jgi:hypothetical protein